MQKKQIRIEIKLDKATVIHMCDAGISLYELHKMLMGVDDIKVVAARVDHEIKELGFRLESDCKVDFVDLKDTEGVRIYRRSLQFLLIKAVKDLFPGRSIIIGHSISKGVYCDIKGTKKLTEDDVKNIEKQMHYLVNRKIPFNKQILTLEEGKKYYKKMGLVNKYNAIEFREKNYITLYECDGMKNYFYGYMVPHTGYLRIFELRAYKDGLILRFPDKEDPDKIPEFVEQEKLFNIFKEFKEWNKILGISNVGDINKLIIKGELDEFIRVAEALQEKKIANIADMICDHKEEKKVVLIAGPSSSGKTTFAKRLAIQLKVNKKKPVTIGLDDYFLNRYETPKDEDGKYDYESIEALDVDLFNKNLLELIDGKEASIPTYDFKNGRRSEKIKKLKLEDNNIIIIEGIHGLNEKLTALIKKENKFKIYVSALTSLNLDEHNRILTTDNRLIRRMVRDNQFRGISAEQTIDRWASVRRGEERNIFPFQESADVIFNSALIYEIFVLKKYAEKLLFGIDKNSEKYSDAKRLLEFLSYFITIENENIPSNSIIKEFIGGTCFEE